MTYVVESHIKPLKPIFETSIETKFELVHRKKIRSTTRQISCRSNDAELRVLHEHPHGGGGATGILPRLRHLVSAG